MPLAFLLPALALFSRGRTLDLKRHRSFIIVATGLLSATVVTVTNVALTFRYTADFYPLLAFLMVASIGPVLESRQGRTVKTLFIGVVLAARAWSIAVNFALAWRGHTL